MSAGARQRGPRDGAAEEQAAGLTALDGRELGGEGRGDAGIPQLHDGRAFVL